MAYSRGKEPAGFGSREQRIEEGNRTMLEQENDAKWAELGDQVSLLKSLSVEINNEVDSQNTMLGGMGESFSSVTGLFTNTLSKMGEMLSSSGGEHMYYLIVFVVVIFFGLYFLM